MQNHPPTGKQTPRQRLYGVYPAIVKDVADPDDQGRVQIELPWVDSTEGRESRMWARLATMMAGSDRGSWFVPDVEDEVLVSFISGDPRWPVVVGALWNGVDSPPESMDSAGRNDIRALVSRAGHQVRFEDRQGSGQIRIETAGGHRIVLDDEGTSVTVEHSGGSRVEMDAGGSITVDAVASVTVNAPEGATVNTAKLQVNASMSQFSGVVQAQSVVTNSVVSSLYNPAAGNVL